MKIIAGPCQYENIDISLEIAETCRDICKNYSIDYIFKASFDKANRTSASGKGYLDDVFLFLFFCF